MLGRLKSKLPILLLGLGFHFTNAEPSCSDLIIKVSAHSEPKEIILPPEGFKSSPLYDVLNAVVGNIGRFWPPFPVGGTYDISAIYCEPKDAGAVDTVQLLSHGATYNKLYWHGLGLPKEEARKYSWAHAATEKGYATLAIDRLGVGNSTHPDPALEVQQHLSAEIILEIAEQLRKGEVVNKKFSKVVLVGHSMGSLIANVATQRRPKAFDAVILTGWSTNFIENSPKVFAGLQLPAALVDPTRFKHLNLGYLTFSLKVAVTRLFYGPEGTYDQKVRDFDWDHRDVVGAGEFITLLEGTNVSPYPGPIHIIDGEIDQSFCKDGKCSPGPEAIPGNTASTFPNSRNFTYSITPGTAHDLNLHKSAPKTFEAASEFLKYNLN